MFKSFTGIIIAIIISFFCFCFPIKVFADDLDDVNDFDVDFTDEDVTVPEDIILSEPSAEPVITSVFTDVVTDIDYFMQVNLSYLVNQLDSSAADHDYNITYPDDFDDVVSDVIYDLGDVADPSLYKDFFIRYILAELGITIDNPLYPVFYDVLSDYYDQITGVAQQEQEQQSLVLIVCILGSISSLGVIKWIF